MIMLSSIDIIMCISVSRVIAVAVGVVAVDVVAPGMHAATGTAADILAVHVGIDVRFPVCVFLVTNVVPIRVAACILLLCETSLMHSIYQTVYVFFYLAYIIAILSSLWPICPTKLLCVSKLCLSLSLSLQHLSV